MTDRFMQGDVVFLKDENTLPNGFNAKHPLLIINCNSFISYEGKGKYFYVGVMLTHSNARDKCTILLKEEDAEGKFQKWPIQIRKHLVFGFNHSDISTFCNRLNKSSFRRILQEIKDDLFAID